MSSYEWTIPIGKDKEGKTKLAYLTLPERNMSEAEWHRLIEVLEMFKPGLVIGKAAEEAREDEHKRT